MAGEKQVEKRIEYRVVGDIREGERSITCGSLKEARARARNVVSPGSPVIRPWKNVRIQESTVTESRTPWEDVADGA